MIYLARRDQLRRVVVQRLVERAGERRRLSPGDGVLGHYGELTQG